MFGNKFDPIIKRIKNNIFIKAFIKLINDDGLEYAGYLAYLNMFSLFPLFIILVSSVGLVADTNTSTKLIETILSYMPSYAVGTIKSQITAITQGPPTSILSFAFLSALWTTTSSLEGLKTSFNKVYKVTNPPFFVKSRLFTILQFLIIIITLIATILALVILPHILSVIENFLNIRLTILNLKHWTINYLLTLSILTLIVAYLYYSLTNKKISFISVLPGSIITILLWTVSAKMMAIYLELQLKQISVVYGSLSGILIILIFLYIVNFVLLYGAELNYVLRPLFPQNLKKSSNTKNR